jgi:hypothetical protein
MYIGGRGAAMVDFPGPDPPTMKVISLAGKKRHISRRMGVSGRPGYANETERRDISPLHFTGHIFQMFETVRWRETISQN